MSRNDRGLPGALRKKIKCVVLAMADKKNKAEKAETKEQAVYKDEKMLGEALTRLNDELLKEMKARPYLIVVASGYEIGKEGELSKFAPQWAWRSNVFVNNEGGKKIVEFLSNQLGDAVEHPEKGVKAQYRMK